MASTDRHAQWIKPNLFQARWIDALRRQLEPGAFNEAMEYFCTHPVVFDEITSAEIRDERSGVHKARAAWQQYKQREKEDQL